jgi:hypothetical protein
MRQQRDKTAFLISSTKVTGAAGINQLSIRPASDRASYFRYCFRESPRYLRYECRQTASARQFLPVEVLAELAFTPRRQQDSIK